MKQTRLPITAILEELADELGEVASFASATFCRFRTGDFDSVRLECGGRAACFSAGSVKAKELSSRDRDADRVRTLDDGAI